MRARVKPTSAQPRSDGTLSSTDVGVDPFGHLGRLRARIAAQPSRPPSLPVRDAARSVYANSTISSPGPGSRQGPGRRRRGGLATVPSRATVRRRATVPVAGDVQAADSRPADEHAPQRLAVFDPVRTLQLLLEAAEVPRLRLDHGDRYLRGRDGWPIGDDTAELELSLHRPGLRRQRAHCDVRAYPARMTQCLEEP